MRTKPARSDEERIRAFNELLNRPSIVEIDEATAYWLEGEDGRPIGEESATSEVPLLAVLAEVDRGVDPLGLTLVCNAPTDDAPGHARYVISSGAGLVDMAESAAAIPARPRIPARGGRTDRKRAQNRLALHHPRVD
jgi:hypothetical protein